MSNQKMNIDRIARIVDPCDHKGGCINCWLNAFQQCDRMEEKDYTNSDVATELKARDMLKSMGCVLYHSKYRYCSVDLRNNYMVIDVKRSSCDAGDVEKFKHKHGLLIEFQKLANLLEIKNKISDIKYSIILYVLADGSMWSMDAETAIYHEAGMSSLTTNGKPARYLPLCYWNRVVDYESLIRNPYGWGRCRYCRMDVYGLDRHNECVLNEFRRTHQ